MDARSRARLESARVMLEAPRPTGDTEGRLRALEDAVRTLIDALLSTKKD